MIFVNKMNLSALAWIERDNKIKDNTIVFNGLTYGLVLSPYTGRVWLDRNLGATFFNSSLVGTLKPTGQISLTPPSAQAAVLSVPSASVVVQSLECWINLFVAFPLSTQQYGLTSQTGFLGIRLMCPNGATRLPVC
jgi:hypothetical protein